MNVLESERCQLLELGGLQILEVSLFLWIVKANNRVKKNAPEKLKTSCCRAFTVLSSALLISWCVQKLELSHRDTEPKSQFSMKTETYELGSRGIRMGIWADILFPLVWHYPGPLDALTLVPAKKLACIWIDSLEMYYPFQKGTLSNWQPD